MPLILKINKKNNKIRFNTPWCHIPERILILLWILYHLPGNYHKYQRNNLSLPQERIFWCAEIYRFVLSLKPPLFYSRERCVRDLCLSLMLLISGQLYHECVGCVLRKLSFVISLIFSNANSLMASLYLRFTMLITSLKFFLGLGRILDWGRAPAKLILKSIIRREINKHFPKCILCI
jgi:hypothetical protein